MEQRFPQVKKDVDVLQSRPKKMFLQTHLDPRPRFVLLLPGQPLNVKALEVLCL